VTEVRQGTRELITPETESQREIERCHRVPTARGFPPANHRQASRPPGYRVLHVLVPERTFNHVKAQAFLSGLRFPVYVARFLNEARPYPETALPAAGEDTNDVGS